MGNFRSSPSNTKDALYRHVNEEDKTTTLIQGTGSKYKSKAVIQSHAEERGESLNAFVNRAISETMERDKSAE